MLDKAPKFHVAELKTELILFYYNVYVVYLEQF